MQTKKAYLGLTSYQEKVYFERWKIPIYIYDSEAPGMRPWQNIDPSMIAYPPGCHYLIIIHS